MKHTDKLFLLISIAVLGCSFWYYSSSMPSLDKERAKHSSKLNEQAEGFKWKDVSVQKLVVKSLEWPEVKAQDAEGKWFFQVFTPPQIWIDKQTGKFMTESPYYKEVARQQFAYSFEGVTNEPYYIVYRGFYGAIKDPYVQLKDTRTGKVMQGKIGSEIIIPATNLTKAVNTGITIKSFDAKRVKKASGMIDQEITIRLFDKALGKEVEIYSFKPTVLEDQRRMTLKAADGTQWHIKNKGDSIVKGDAKYVVEKVSLDKEFVFVKMIPQKDNGEERVMKVSASGVESK